MERSTEESSRTIKETGRARSNGLMAANTKVAGRRINRKGKVCITTMKAWARRESG